MTNTRRDRARPIAGLALGLALTFLGGVALAGPGTQTEDDIYVGNKRKARGVTTPAAARPAATTTTPKPLLAGAATAPLAVPSTARSAAPAPGVLTKKPVQGVTTPGTAAPLPRPGAGVSPNTGRTAPAVLPGK